ncbi:hypothetical protein [Paenibacillus sp. ALJ109b]|uniref:hypothetical protein n=1 Tax=Paenibacillus sp. ALJ109b TaxID=2709068 RepID=UPI0013D5CBE5|nr:hypothetical protein [Paenibacillus sp. ALJ109b]NEU64828.1 hypothetical protein [Paenibacillus sp. ALJ109b]
MFGVALPLGSFRSDGYNYEGFTIEERDCDYLMENVVLKFFKNKACVRNLYMVYSNSGQENTRNTVRQANEISFERNLKKELAKLVRMWYDIKVAEVNNTQQ